MDQRSNVQWDNDGPLSFYFNHHYKTSTGFPAGQIFDCYQSGWVRPVVVMPLYFRCQFRSEYHSCDQSVLLNVI